MKRIFSIFLGVLLVAGAVSAYTVNGKVYQKGTTIPVNNASVSLTTTESGVTIKNNGVTAIDGSFSITLSGMSCKGKKMTLKATKTSGPVTLSGSTIWYANAERETKNVYIIGVFNLNPDINLYAEPVPFETVGQIKTIPVKAFVDELSAPVLVQGFNMTLAYDNSVFNVLGAELGPLFPGGMIDVNETAGTVTVWGDSPEPVQLPSGEFGVDSFFDVFVEIEIPSSGSETKLEMLPGPDCVFYDPGGIEICPVPSEAMSKLGEPMIPPASVHIDDFIDWDKLISNPPTELNIRPMFEVEWNEYMGQWVNGEIEGLPYPDTNFMPAELYVYEDDGTNDGEPAPEGDGLIMKWGEEDKPSGEYASGWVMDYGTDPDLTNCTIQVSVMPPSACNINAVSFAMVDINGNRRSWWWNVPGPINYDVANTVTINTANSGLGATTPAATGYMNTPGFDITQVQSFDVDENAQWIFGTQPVPPFNTQIFAANWNYWHNLIVRKNQSMSGYKGYYVKYSQPIVELDNPDGMTLINGWDEVSNLNSLINNNLAYPVNYYDPPRIMADDWKCADERPVTDIHWWGSFLGWSQPAPPPIVPTAFHIGIWTDVPAGVDEPWSHPGEMIWENYCDSWVWNFAGYDVDPRPEPMVDEACFQFNQLLSENEWFYQQPMGYDDEGNAIPNTYWLSIVPVYDPSVIEDIRHPWGWKTRPHIYMDDAVRIFDTDGAFPGSPPSVGDHWTGGEHVFLVNGDQEVSWDLAFELTTNEPAPPRSADLNLDGIVNFEDMAEMANQWLTDGL